MNTPSKQRKKRLWIAVAQLKPKAGNDMLGGAAGAFVPVLVLAESAREVISRIKAKATAYDFTLCGVQDIAPLTRSCRQRISPGLLKLASKLTLDDPVAFGTFHSYEE